MPEKRFKLILGGIVERDLPGKKSMKRIHIIWGVGQVSVVLKDTPTSRKIIDALPIESEARIWGSELYFSTPVESELEEDARDVVEPGTVCFWVEGNSIAVPWGPTPISRDRECRLASRVNIVGHLDCDPYPLENILEGAHIKVEII